jgi:hypothetical protein
VLVEERDGLFGDRARSRMVVTRESEELGEREADFE